MTTTCLLKLLECAESIAAYITYIVIKSCLNLPVHLTCYAHVHYDLYYTMIILIHTLYTQEISASCSVINFKLKRALYALLSQNLKGPMKSVFKLFLVLY